MVESDSLNQYLSIQFNDQRQLFLFRFFYNFIIESCTLEPPISTATCQNLQETIVSFWQNYFSTLPLYQHIISYNIIRRKWGDNGKMIADCRIEIFRYIRLICLPSGKYWAVEDNRSLRFEVEASPERRRNNCQEAGNDLYNSRNKDGGISIFKELLITICYEFWTYHQLLRLYNQE